MLKGKLLGRQGAGSSLAPIQMPFVISFPSNSITGVTIGRQANSVQ
jgi:hypothetical protein